jgi:hypothetical protein
MGVEEGTAGGDGNCCGTATFLRSLAPSSYKHRALLRNAAGDAASRLAHFQVASGGPSAPLSGKSPYRICLCNERSPGPRKICVTAVTQWDTCVPT